MADQPTKNILSLWLEHKKIREKNFRDITLGVVGSYTTEPLEAYLGHYLLNREYKAPQIDFAGFDQIHAVCQNPKHFFKPDTDAIIIFWKIEDFLPDPPNIQDNKIYDVIDTLIRSIKTLIDHYKGLIIISDPPYPSYPSYDLTSLETSKHVFNSAITYWTKSIQDIPSVHRLDINALLLREGLKNALSRKKFALYRQPWNEEFWSLIGKQVGRIICKKTRSAKKCIVVDADNTLWGGIIGEDGLSGIALGNDFPGSAYRNFQKELLLLQKNGIMLAVASKNNESDFFEVFDKHDAMVLKKENFLEFQIHWNSKASSIRQISKKLNIGTDSIIFIDDNPKELDEVKTQIPDVTCLQVPEELSELPYIFFEKDFFDQNALTSEDLNRNDMMKTEEIRHTAQQSMSEIEFKNSLELKAEIFVAKDEHIARIAQLINKTNQFNLTTIRRTYEDVLKLSQSEKHNVIGMMLKDKYGEYGLIGAAILTYTDDKICEIDTLLMSCRVLGRSAETAFLYGLFKIAADEKVTKIQAKYIPSAKNKQTETFYKLHGFDYNQKDDNWICTIDKTPENPAYIETKIINKK